MKVVDLDRVFGPLPDDDPRGNRSSWREASPDVNARPWPELLEHRRVVLLAEAASGKTTEFRTRAEKLDAGGKAAFFLDLASLAEGGLTACLDVTQQRRFDAWRQSTEDAWFFLDAVDELRLTRKTLETALNKLAHELDAALDRARVFVSSRITDWRGKDDLETIERCLPTPRADSRKPGTGTSIGEMNDHLAEETSAREDVAAVQPVSPLVVTLKPLDRGRMGRLAAAYGVGEIEAFLDAIARRGLEALAERPGDLVMLAKYWNGHRALGRPAEMMEELVAEKLRELNDRFRREDAPGSRRAREAVERIAAAMTLGQTLTIATPASDADSAASGDALDPRSVLLELNDVQRDALLRLGVFAPETFGRIRFHHRMTQEYLTACWLRRLVAAEGRGAVEDLVFASPHGVDVVRPALRAAAAWLALWDRDTCREVTRREPRLLVEGGDPSTLPLPARRDVLAAFADMIARRETSDAWIDNRMLALFADQALAPDIRALWELHRSGDVRSFLLRLVRWGPITGCADLAAEVLRDPHSDAELGLYALRAAEACGDADGLRLAADHVLRDPASIPSRYIAMYLDVLVPTFVPAAEVARVVGAHAAGSSYGVERAIEVIAESAKRWSPSDRLALLSGIVAATKDVLSCGHRLDAEDLPPPGLARHLGPLLAPILADFADTDPDPAMIEALALFEPHGDYREAVRLKAIVAARPRVNRALFWHDVETARRRRPDRPIEHPFDARPQRNRLWTLSWKGAAWLLEDVAARPRAEDRALALTALVDSARAAGVLEEQRACLVRVANEAGLAAHLERLLTPQPPSPEQVEYEARSARRAEERRLQQEEAQRSWAAFVGRLKADPDALAVRDPPDDRVLNNLVNLYNRLCAVAQPRSPLHWSSLTPEFDADVAERYAQALKRLWRVTEPLPATSDGNTVTRTSAGVLSRHGLDLEAADDPGWIGRLTDTELERALNHVLAADEQLPSWFAPAACARPNVSRPPLAGRLDHEWNRETSYSPLLSALAHGAEDLLGLMRPDMLALVLRPARDLHRIDAAIRIVRRLQPERAERTRLADAATAHLHAARQQGDEQMALGYLRLLFLLSPMAAASAIDAWLRAAPPSDQHRTAIAILAALEDDIGPVRTDDLREAVSALAALVRLAFRHVRPEDDRRREGVYTPDQRDAAEMTRGRLFHVLVETPGAEAHAALVDLVNDDEFIRGRPRLRRAIRDHALVDAARPPLRPADVIRVEREHLAPIQNGDDLYRHVLRELEGIERGFREEDFSSRDVVATAKDERSVQTWLAERLKERSRGRWDVVREAGVADNKKPDICIHAIAGPWQMAIEVKLCVPNGKWSQTKLEATLHDQLVGLYLRIDQRRHGCLVIINQGKTWKAPDGTAIDFQTALAELNTLAQKINATQPVTVSVVGIEAGSAKKKAA